MMDAVHKRTLNLDCKRENENKLPDLVRLIYEMQTENIVFPDICPHNYR